MGFFQHQLPVLQFFAYRFCVIQFNPELMSDSPGSRAQSHKTALTQMPILSSRIKPLIIHLLTFNNQIRCLTVLRKVLYFVLLVCYKTFNFEQPLGRDAQGEALELGEGEKWSFHTLSTHPILAPSTCISTWKAFQTHPTASVFVCLFLQFNFEYVNKKISGTQEID